uniref:ATP synthase subunit a n=1 Tax=Lepidurus apus lubbocki TaxID=217954 RepID=A0A5B7XVB5_9CRUS|nr:ATP synthase F0 subunit 6 [Lepidurus apus lubbocki]QCZ36053.1 ATP synthase F0 subunit 6 [Lepidurus apus lubbocki]
MMTNLFSVFDPSTSMGLPLNWLSSLLLLMFVPSMFWLIPSRLHFVWSSIMSSLHVEFKTLLNSNSMGSTLMFISLFIFIIFNNFLGLFPYIFTSTSHLSMTLALSFPMWISFMCYGWMNHTQHMFAHLVPQGTPSILMPFMVCIETISNLIRPGTLAVRLAANMIAGHLLLTLLGNQGPNSSSLILTLLISTQIMLLMLESAVAVIQAYVFAILSTLYSSETS